MSKKQLDRISYSEGVKVSLGDYESRDVHISVSLSTDVQEGKSVDKAIKKARKVVQNRLKIAEKKIRKSAEDDVDFETIDRLNYYD